MYPVVKPVIAVLIFSSFFVSCKPVVHSFTAVPNPVVDTQKVQLNWKVSGTPTLEFNEHVSVDSVHLLEFTLIVKKGEKEARQTIQVQKVNQTNTIQIAFVTSRREGDTVIASDKNNANQWGKFGVVSVSAASSRDLIVVHDGRTATLKADGSPSAAFANTSAGGDWTFKTILTAEEKADPTKIPEQLKISAIIRLSNQ